MSKAASVGSELNNYGMHNDTEYGESKGVEPFRPSLGKSYSGPGGLGGPGGLSRGSGSGSRDSDSGSGSGNFFGDEDDDVGGPGMNTRQRSATDALSRGAQPSVGSVGRVRSSSDVDCRAIAA